MRRKDFGLASLFGAGFAGKVEGPMLNSYLLLEKDPATGTYHPLLTGFEDTELPETPEPTGLSATQYGDLR